MGFDFRWVDTEPSSTPSTTSTTSTRFVSRTMSSPEVKKSSDNDMPSVGRYRHDQFVGLTIASEETGLPTSREPSSEWSGKAKTEKNKKDVNISPTGSTSKSSKLQAIKRDLKMMFPISYSAGKPSSRDAAKTGGGGMWQLCQV